MEFRKGNMLLKIHKPLVNLFIQIQHHNIYDFFRKDLVLVFEECMYMCVYVVCVCMPAEAFDPLELEL